MIGQQAGTTSEAAPPGNWMTLGQIVAVMALSSAAELITATTPLLYSRMVIEHRMATAQIGQIVTAEGIALTVVTALAAVWMKADRLRFRFTVAASIFTLANVATAWVDYPLVFLPRVIVGGCNGAAIWLLMQMYARAPHPVRLYGIYLVWQSILGVALTALFTGVIIPPFGASGGFICLGVGGIMLIGASRALPDKLAPLPRYESKAGGLTLRTAIGLATGGLGLAGAMAIWVHLPPLALQQHQPPWAIATAVPLAVAMQGVGGLAAALLHSLSPRTMQISIWAVMGALGVLWIYPQAPWLFVAMSAAFGFLWMFFIPYNTGYMVVVDPTRRSLAYLAVVQPLGASLGPVGASLAVVSDDVRGSVLVGVGLLAVGIMLILVEIGKRLYEVRT